MKNKIIDAALKEMEKILQLYADTFGTMVNHIGRDLQNMYPAVWKSRQDLYGLKTR